MNTTGPLQIARATSTAPHEPTWEPLKRVLTPGLIAEQFKWMYAQELEDGQRLHIYRHIGTRQWLHLSTDGGTFSYVGPERGEARTSVSVYVEEPVERAVFAALTARIPRHTAARGAR